jgi:hypothetical protein
MLCGKQHDRGVFAGKKNSDRKRGFARHFSAPGLQTAASCPPTLLTGIRRKMWSRNTAPSLLLAASGFPSFPFCLLSSLRQIQQNKERNQIVLRHARLLPSAILSHHAAWPGDIVLISPGLDGRSSSHRDWNGSSGHGAEPTLCTVDMEFRIVASPYQMARISALHTLSINGHLARRHANTSAHRLCQVLKTTTRESEVTHAATVRGKLVPRKPHPTNPHRHRSIGNNTSSRYSYLGTSGSLFIACFVNLHSTPTRNGMTQRYLGVIGNVIFISRSPFVGRPESQSTEPRTQWARPVAPPSRSSRKKRPTMNGMSNPITMCGPDPLRTTGVLAVDLGPVRWQTSGAGRQRSRVLQACGRVFATGVCDG